MADGFVTKYGPARVLKICGGLILGGLWLAAALPYLIPATLGFLLVGFLVGPPVIGWLAEATGLRIAISIAACLGLMIAFVAAKVGRRLS